MQKTELFTIDGQPMLVPDADLSILEEDVVSSDSGYDESGVYHHLGLGKRVRSWDFSYARLTRQEYAYLEKLFAGKDTVCFGFVAFDESWQEVTAYRSKRTVLWHNATDDTFRDYRFRITEC